MFLSLLGQFVIHLFVMQYAVAISKPFLPDNFAVPLSCSETCCSRAAAQH